MTHTKFHDPWAVTHYQSAGAFNHLEAQWTDIKLDIDAHNHDDLYYTEAYTDPNFFTTASYAGFDADMLDGDHLADILNTVMPTGAIMIWYGTDANVPTGWAICNGQTVGSVTTPDLRDRFIIGSGGSYSTGDSGAGSTTYAITGSFTVDSHTVTNDEFPLHTHAFSDYSNGTGNCFTSAWRDGSCGSSGSNNRTTGSAGSGTGHTHTGNSITLSDLTSVVPAYHALYYIEKII